MLARHTNTVRNSSNTRGKHMRASPVAGGSNSLLGMLGRGTDPKHCSAPRRATPPARAAPAGQCAAPKINHTQSPHACSECISSAQGAGDARSRPDMSECLVKARHQNTAGATALQWHFALLDLFHQKEHRSQLAVKHLLLQYALYSLISLLYLFVVPRAAPPVPDYLLQVLRESSCIQYCIIFRI